MARRIDCVEDVLISGHESFILHFGNEINGKIRVIPGHVSDQAVFLFEPLIEFCSVGGIEQTDHGRNDSSLLNKVYLFIKDGGRVAIKSEDEASLNFKTMVLN